jgi:hypothetical protein
MILFREITLLSFAFIISFRYYRGTGFWISASILRKSIDDIIMPRISKIHLVKACQ